MPADGSAPADTIDCCFCLEPVRRGALVCRHCHRDLSVPMPLLQAQAAQKAEIEALKDDMAALRAELLLLRESGAAPQGGPGPAVTTVPSRGGPELALAVGWVLALAASIGLHWLLVIRQDVAVAVFRAAALAAPLLVALCVPGLWRVRPAILAAASAALGLAAVLAMSYDVAVHDGTPVLPTTGADLYEMAEFALAIGLSFLCGALVLRAVFRIRATRAHVALIEGVRGAVKGADPKGLGQRAETLKNMTEAAIPITAAAGALFAGFRSLFGG